MHTAGPRDAFSSFLPDPLFLYLPSLFCIYRLNFVRLPPLLCIYRLYFVRLPPLFCIYRLHFVRLPPLLCIYRLYFVRLRPLFCIYRLYFVRLPPLFCFYRLHFVRLPPLLCIYRLFLYLPPLFCIYLLYFILYRIYFVHLPLLTSGISVSDISATVSVPRMSVPANSAEICCNCLPSLQIFLYTLSSFSFRQLSDLLVDWVSERFEEISGCTCSAQIHLKRKNDVLCECK